MIKLDKNTKEDADGIEIVCPKCNKQSTVFHLNWTALSCKHCHQDVNYEQWIIPVVIAKE